MDFDFSTLITDRSPSDLELLRDLLSTPMSDWTAEQLAAFNQAISKGAYNYTDLNRVTACMDYLNERLTAAGYVTGYAPVEVPHSGSGSRLPEGYTELEYIESSGTQYIDTGFKPNQDTRVVCDTEFAASTTAYWLFGSRVSTNDRNYAFLTYEGGYRSDYNDTAGDVIGGVSGRFIVDKNKNITYIDEVVKDELSYGAFQSTYNLYIFRSNNGGTPSASNTAKIYSCQIYDNGLLIRDFVPCIDPEGTVGLYDFDGKQFYNNAGAGSFIAGPEVTPDPGDILDPYTWYEMDIPTYPQMQRYITNGKVLRETLALPENTAAMPEDMVGLTQEEANAIEGVLGIIEGWIHNMAAAWFYSGDLYAGEV